VTRARSTAEPRIRGALHRPALLRVPTVARPAVLAGTTGLLYANGIVFLVLIHTVGFPLDHPLAAHVIAGIAAVVGLVTLRFGKHFPRAVYHVLVAGGVVVLSGVVMSAQGEVATVALAPTFAFIVLDAAYFFSWVGAGIHVALAMAASAAVLARAGLHAGPIMVLEMVLLIIAGVVAWLARNADAAEQDPLTMLLNRRGFDRVLETAIDRAERDHGRLSIVLLDIDHFKSINDTSGHQSGDRLLQLCATRWRRALPPSAELARYGGDEFALLLLDTPLGRAADLADFLRTLLPDDLRVSAGVAAWQRGDSASILMGRVDVSLYDAKSAGRDQIAVYGDPGRAASELEAAIGNGEMVLHYQPVVRLSDRAVVSREALVRWEHPRRGMVPPGEFVPQAERTGAIHSLGAWTLDNAGRAAARWNADGSPISVSVNVSIEELRSPEYPEAFRTALAASWLSPEQLVVEVTEAVFDAGDEQVARSLLLIRELGVRIAIDDFGTGYSSMRWLDKFPLDILKVDASFVRSITHEDQHTPILQAMIAMGRALGLTVIAEGVETEHQAAVLRRLGCELAQGYLFGRPAPLTDHVAA